MRRQNGRHIEQGGQGDDPLLAPVCDAVGDGANDLPMMKAAGLSIAYHPKPAVAEQAMITIASGGLNRALEILLP